MIINPQINYWFDIMFFDFSCGDKIENKNPDNTLHLKIISFSATKKDQLEIVRSCALETTPEILWVWTYGSGVCEAYYYVFDGSGYKTAFTNSIKNGNYLGRRAMLGEGQTLSID